MKNVINDNNDSYYLQKEIDQLMEKMGYQSGDIFQFLLDKADYVDFEDYRGFVRMYDPLHEKHLNHREINDQETWVLSEMVESANRAYNIFLTDRTDPESIQSFWYSSIKKLLREHKIPYE